jgi:hypothetical protein
MSTNPEGVTNPASEGATREAAWPRWQRCGFRFLVIYYALYSFPSLLGHLLGTVGKALATAGVGVDPGQWLEEAVAEAWKPLTTWMHALGFAPYEVIHQQTGSGDTGADFARLIAITALSMVGATVWSLRSRARGYPRLGRWLHLVVRFDLAFTLLSYGTSKFYGGQFGELSLDRLTQEIGDTWPMTMVGTFMQASPPYEWFAGGSEVLGGLLLFHRRTALLGAFVSIGVLINVCALNWLCGVPVKQYSAHLLLYAIALLLPFRRQLWALFAGNRGAQPVDLRVVQSARAARWLTAFGAILVVAWLALTHVQGIAPRPWMKGREKSALYGMWTVETMLLDGKEVPVTDGTRWRDFAVDRGTMAWTREETGRRHWFEFRWDEASGTAKVKEMSKSPGEGATWICERGRKCVKCDPPLLLHTDDRGKKVDGERRTLVLKGQWGEHELELHTVEKVFRLQTGFRLRQELPDFW